VSAVKDVEKRLGPLLQLQELSKNTEEKLTSLNALAEHVTTKAKALEHQKSAVERAVVEANRLNEMVWNMDVQITRLNDGLKTGCAHRGNGRADREAGRGNQREGGGGRQVTRRIGAAIPPVRKDGRNIVDTMRGHVEKLALEKKEFEAFDQRLRALQLALGEAEARMDALTNKEKHLASLNQRVEGLNKDFQSLMAHADELTKKQASLETLHERLMQIDELSKRTTTQYDSLKQSRQDLEALRKTSSNSTSPMPRSSRSATGSVPKRAKLEAFGDRMTAFMTRTPQLEATMDAINAKLGVVDEGTKKATRLGEVAAELDSQLTRVSARGAICGKLEGRVNSLHVMTADVDRKLGEQLARRAELDMLKSQCDGILAQMLRRAPENRGRRSTAGQGAATRRRLHGASGSSGPTCTAKVLAEAVIDLRQSVWRCSASEPYARSTSSAERIAASR